MHTFFFQSESSDACHAMDATWVTGHDHDENVAALTAIGGGVSLHNVFIHAFAN